TEGDDLESTLEEACRLDVRVLRPSACAGLDRVAPSFHPTRRTVKMEREQLRSLTRIGRVAPLDRVAGPPVKLAPAPVRETLVGCLANERVTKAEAVRHIRIGLDEFREVDLELHGGVVCEDFGQQCTRERHSED